MITKIRNAIKRYGRIQRTIRELETMSDRDLADIGISRVDIYRIAKESVSE